MNTPIGKSTIGEMLPFFIVIGVLTLFIIFCVRMFVVTSKAKKEGKKKMKNLKN